MSTPDDPRAALEIPAAEAAAIEQRIASDSSPVGIDAKLTHVLILHKLIEIEKRLARLEAEREPSRGGSGS